MRRPVPALAISSEAQAGLRGDRALGPDGSRRRGGVDAAAVAALWRHGLHVLDDSGGVPDRAGHRQQPGVRAGPRGRQSQGRAGVVPGGHLRGAGLGGVCHRLVAAVLADQPVDLDQPVLYVPAGSDARDLGDAARRHPVGRQLPAGAGGRGHARPGSGAPGGRRVRRQHRGRDCRRAGDEPGPCRHRRAARSPSRRSSAWRRSRAC